MASSHQFGEGVDRFVSSRLAKQAPCADFKIGGKIWITANGQDRHCLCQSSLHSMHNQKGRVAELLFVTLTRTVGLKGALGQ